MCKLIVGIQADDKKETIAASRLIIKAHRSVLWKEKQGIGTFILTRDNKVLIKRSYDNYSEVYDFLMENLPKAKLFVIHSRTSTGGVDSLLNVHLFESDLGNIFAHNGFVSKFSPTRGREGYWANGQWMENKNKKGKDDSQKCDSFQFCDVLSRNPNIAEIERALDDYIFTGAAFLFNRNNRNAFLIIKKPCYCIEKAGTAAFFSFDPELEYEQELYVDVCGVHVKTESKKIQIVEEASNIYEGVYKLKLADGSGRTSANLEV